MARQSVSNILGSLSNTKKNYSNARKQRVLANPIVAASKAAPKISTARKVTAANRKTLVDNSQVNNMRKKRAARTPISRPTTASRVKKVMAAVPKRATTSSRAAAAKRVAGIMKKRI